MRKINLGLIGLGTIGEGVYKLLKSQKNRIRKIYNIDINLVKSCDISQSLGKKLKIQKKFFTNNYSDLINDSNIDTIVELIGGTTIANKIAIDCLNSGKNFITANKALIAKNGTYLHMLAEKKDVHLLYEASVGGGIPILNSIENSININNIKSFYGIMNGTCNYILSLMSDGVDFDEALKNAQNLGFAESDPTLDINGTDTAHKVAILSRNCFGFDAKIEKFHISGIEDISKIDIETANQLGYKIKLIGVGKIKGDKVDLRVHLALLRNSNPLTNVNEEFNAILIDSKNLGPVMKYGYGAGMMPTASAIISDIIKTSSYYKFSRQSFKKYSSFNIDNLKSKFYLRLNVKNKPGNLAKITTLFAKYSINIEKILQDTKNKKIKNVPVIITTKNTSYKIINKVINQLDKLSIISKNPLLIPFED